MKIPRTYRMNVRVIDYLKYVQKTTGVQNTDKIEQLVIEEAKKAALNDPVVQAILDRSEGHYLWDKKEKRGLFAPKST